MESSRIINGRYRIIRKIGEGGMAVVYLAQDEVMHRQVAIKRLYIIGASEDLFSEFVKRFQREAQAMAMLQHPNIVTSLDYGVDESGAYLVLEYLSGGTLRERMDGAMPMDSACAIIRPIAEAMGYLHRRGIIHRDIKPENILFDDQGHPMLADLGIVKLIERGDGTTLTGTGVTIGTPAYMAPELIVGEVSPLIDQYALGVVLYELLTGVKPFSGRTPMETMNLQQNQPVPDPKQYAPNLSDPLCWFLLKTLAKLPEDRFGDMAEFQRIMEGVLTGSNEGFPEIPFGVKGDSMDDVVPADDVKMAGKRKEKKKIPARVFWLGMIVIGLAVILGISSQWLKAKTLNEGPLATQVSETVQTIITPSPTLTQSVTPSAALTKTATAIATTTHTTTPTLGMGSAMTRERDGMPLLYVPEGEFPMGSYDGPQDEHPVHNVYLDAYWVDKYEVTNAQYASCVESGTCSEPISDQSYTRAVYYGIDEFANYPVVWVTWFQSATYCQWAGGRLPTEAEWEKAARGTDGRRYPWGNENPDCEYLNYQGVSNSNNCVVPDTVPVGSYPQGASPYGVMDMAGNVYEWTADWYDGMYYATSSEENPNGSLLGDTRVIRGGYWSSPLLDLRTSFRRHLEPGSRWHEFGFRCVVDVVP